MAKTSGLGDALFVGGYDLSGDIQSLDRVGGGPTDLDMTGIDKSAHERIGGLRDGEITVKSFYNPETIAGGGSRDGAHLVFSALPTADVAVVYCRGTTLGNPAACLIGKQINYDGKRGNDGSYLLDVQALANGYGLEWGEQLTAGKRTDTAATTGTSIDGTAATAFGFQAYLQVFSMAGTDVTVKIQDSADNSTFADLASGAFTQITTTTPQTQRIAVGGTAAVRRYLRATTVTTGGFTSLVFAVVFVRNKTATAF
jgi:hypothetical protein